MVTAYAASQYQEMQVQTTPGKLLLMAYDGALRFLYVGLDALKSGDRAAQGLNLGKAQSVILYLRDTLEPGAGPIAQDLERIYNYAVTRLLRANAEDRADYVQEVINHLTDLRDAWEKADRMVQAQAGEPALAGALR
jgi:flagellar secretion chaperone FliS